MGQPPLSTILIEDITFGGPGEFLFGIDLQFFTVKNKFSGVKNIPLGIHLFHYATPVSTEDGTGESVVSNLRYGFWFECSEGDILVIKWDPENELFRRIYKDEIKDEVVQLDYSKAISDIGSKYPLMINYPQNNSLKLWQTKLSDHIDEEILKDLLDNTDLELNTITASKQENDLLKDALLKKQNNAILSKELESQPQINYTPINFKVNKPFTSVEEVTSNYLDKSWYISEHFPDREFLLAELQVSFIQYVVFGNYCSMVQWLNLLKLLLMSGKLLLSSKSFTFTVLGILKAQLSQLPKEYIVGGDLQNQCLIDLEVYCEIMENYMELFNVWNVDLCCGKLKLQGMIKQVWEEILDLQKREFGLDFHALKGEKEREIEEEDGPVIVAYSQE